MNRLSPQSTVIEKLTFVQLVKRFPTFYGTQMYISVFIRSRHWTSSRATPLDPITGHATGVQMSVLVFVSECLKDTSACRFCTVVKCIVTMSMFRLMLSKYVSIRATCLICFPWSWWREAKQSGSDVIRDTEIGSRVEFPSAPPRNLLILDSREVISSECVVWLTFRPLPFSIFLCLC